LRLEAGITHVEKAVSHATTHNYRPDPRHTNLARVFTTRTLLCTTENADACSILPAIAASLAHDDPILPHQKEHTAQRPVSIHEVSCVSKILSSLDP
jgi:hypothetical protein